MHSCYQFYFKYMYFSTNYPKNVLFIFLYFPWAKGKMTSQDLFTETKTPNDKLERLEPVYISLLQSRRVHLFR